MADRSQANISGDLESSGTQALVADTDIVNVVLEKIKEGLRNGKSMFLLEDFPRNLDQDRIFGELIRVEYKGSIVRPEFIPDLVISIACTKDIAREGYLSCGGATDAPELFEKECSDYGEQEKAIMELYKGKSNYIEVRKEYGLNIDTSYSRLRDLMTSNSTWNFYSRHHAQLSRTKIAVLKIMKERQAQSQLALIGEGQSHS